MCWFSQATPTRQHIVVVVISIDVNRQTSFVENWTTTVFLRGSYERMRAGPVPQKGPKMTVLPGVFDVPDRREIINKVFEIARRSGSSKSAQNDYRCRRFCATGPAQEYLENLFEIARRAGSSKRAQNDYRCRRFCATGPARHSLGKNRKIVRWERFLASPLLHCMLLPSTVLYVLHVLFVCLFCLPCV